MSAFNSGRPVYQKGGRVKSATIRRASRDQTCTIRSNVCNGDPATVVGCHWAMPGFSGMGMKTDDLFILDGCSACHAALDHRDRWAMAGISHYEILRALVETQKRRLDAGHITLA